MQEKVALEKPRNARKSKYESSYYNNSYGICSNLMACRESPLG